MIVEEKYRAKNTMKKGKTSVNAKRGSKPVLRYSHPCFDTEGMYDVLMALPEPGETTRKRKRVNPHGSYAASRDVCFYYILKLHEIRENHWPLASNMKKARK